MMIVAPVSQSHNLVVLIIFTFPYCDGESIFSAFS